MTYAGLAGVPNLITNEICSASIGIVGVHVIP
jgi:hypothetical protein